MADPETRSAEPLAMLMGKIGSLIGKTKSVAEMDDAELIEAGRRSRASNFIIRLMMGFPRRGVAARDLVIQGANGEIPARVYKPSRSTQAAKPLVVAFHGGGWALGGLDGMDWIAGTVARDLDAVVVSVDYRLAPLHRFPAALEDCYDVLVWCVANIADLGATSARVGVIGDSAGGNLAAAVCLLARERGGPAIDHQALIYPATDLSDTTPSRQEIREAPFLTAADLERFARAYTGLAAPDADWRHSPLRAADHSALPPALIQIAGHDPLRDDGILYSRVLKAAGVPVTLTDYPTMPHGFLSFPYCNGAAKAAMRQIVTEQRLFLRARATGKA